MPKWSILLFLLGVVIRVNGGELSGSADNRRSDSTRVQSTRALFTNLKIVPYPRTADQVMLSHFYQQISYDNDRTAGWHVSSAGTVLHGQYFRFGFTIDQADYIPLNDRLWSTGISYRAGVELDQAYSNNNILYFRFLLGSGPYLPGVTVNAGYLWQVNDATGLSLDIQGLEFGKGKCLSLATGVTKSISRHQLTIQPYYLVSSKGKIKLLVADKIYTGRTDNYLMIKFISGYFPDRNTFIDYDQINDKRYRVSCGGFFTVLKKRLSLTPVIGLEYVKNELIYNKSWYCQLGVQLNL